MDDSPISIRDKFYTELNARVEELQKKLKVHRRDDFILGGIEALIINCNRRKALVHRSLVEGYNVNHLEFFVNRELFKRYSKDNDNYVTIELLGDIKVDLINHVPKSFNGSDFKYAAGEFLLSDEELRERSSDGEPYGLLDEDIQELKFALGVLPRLHTQANSIYESMIPKDYLDGDYPTIVYKSISGIIEEEIKNIYFKFLKMVLDTSISLTVIDGFITKYGLKESLVERILVIRSLNLNQRMKEVLEEYHVSLENY